MPWYGQDVATRPEARRILIREGLWIFIMIVLTLASVTAIVLSLVWSEVLSFAAAVVALLLVVLAGRRAGAAHDAFQDATSEWTGADG